MLPIVMNEKTKRGYPDYPAVYVPPETKDRLLEMANAEHRSMPQEITWLVEQEAIRRTEAADGGRLDSDSA